MTKLGPRTIAKLIPLEMPIKEKLMVDTPFQIIKDPRLKEVVIDFCKSDYNNEEFDGAHKYTYERNYRRGWKIFVHLFDEYCYDDLSWSFLCTAMHRDVELAVDRALSQTTSDHARYKNAFIARKILERFFLYLLERPDFVSHGVERLKPFKHLVFQTAYARNFDKSDDVIIETRVSTNYPIDSEPQSVFQYNYINNHKMQGCMNLNLHTTNSFLMQLLTKFIEQFKGNSIPSQIYYRIFYYYFETSFEPYAVPVAISDFCYDTFKTQYEFYKQIKFTQEERAKASAILKDFYVFLLDYIKDRNIQHDIFSGYWDRRTLVNHMFFEHYNAGYRMVLYSRMDDIPTFDKWLLYPNEDVEKSAGFKNDNNKTLNFGKVRDLKYRQDLKEWIWFGPGLVQKRSDRCSILIEFLEFKDEFDTRRKKIISLSAAPEFPLELLFQYRLFINEKYYNNLRYPIDAVKSFITFFAEKYSIDQKAWRYLKFKKKHDQVELTGGNPLSPEEIEIVAEEFRKIELEQGDFGKQVNTFFYLALTQKFRPGELRGLKRNCIVKRFPNGDGIIKVNRKMAGREYVKFPVINEVIVAIDEVINITEEIAATAPEELKDYIFLTMHNRNVVRMNFAGIFKGVVEMLETEGRLRGGLAQYNLRDTFIDAIMDEGIKEKIDPSILADITGNCHEVSIRHYKKKAELKSYLEVMARVRFTDVDLNGAILEDELLIEDKPPVMDNLGACDQEDCTWEENHPSDSFANCLKCTNFLTVLSRIPIFERNIHALRHKADNTEFEEERKLLEAEILLHCNYLERMVDMYEKHKKTKKH